MARYQPKEEQASPAPEQPKRKIGYVAQHLDSQETTPTTKPEPEAKPFIITDWASI